MQHKWLTKLLGLDYEIQYKKRADNEVADVLSRRRMEGEYEEHGVVNHLCVLSAMQPVWMRELAQSYEGDGVA